MPLIPLAPHYKICPILKEGEGGGGPPERGKNVDVRMSFLHHPKCGLNTVPH